MLPERWTFTLKHFFFHEMKKLQLSISRVVQMMTNAIAAKNAEIDGLARGVKWLEPQAKGKGTVVEKMILKPPMLVSQKVKDYSDGRIYHIIMRGQGLMGHYANQLIHEKDRWAVINYIRSLQEKN